MIKTNESKLSHAKYMKVWRKANPEKVTKAYMKWVRANREASRLYKVACKFRQKANGYISKLILEQIIAKNRAKHGKLTCELCKKRIVKSKKLPKMMSFDHKLPIRLGGTNNPRNIQILHHLCNNIKGNRLMEVFQ